MFQAMASALAFFYSPYLDYPYLVLITMTFMGLAAVTLVNLDYWVKPMDKLVESKEDLFSDEATSDDDLE